MVNSKITKQYLRENNACSESYPWLKKQKKKDWVSVSHQLYKEKKYNWCLWILYRNTFVAKVYLWFLVILSFVLSGVSIGISLNSESNTAIAAVVIAVTAITAIVVIAVAIAAVVIAVTAITAVTAIVVIAVAIAAVVIAVTAITAVTIAVGAAAATIAAATIAAVAIATVATADNFIFKIGCKLSIKKK